jgi:FlaA1/EpsC-like NDP-sugar epimerase
MPTYLRQFAVHLLRRLAGGRRWILRAVHLAIFLTAGTSAFLLRFDFAVPQEWRRDLLVGICTWTLAKAVVFHFFKLDRGWWRYTSVPDIIRLIVGNVLGSAISCVGILLVIRLFCPPNFPAFPRSLYPLDFLLCLAMTSGVRLVVRVGYEATRIQSEVAKKRTLIYGAGDAGVLLLREIAHNPALAYDIVGFVDDSAGKVGLTIQRVKILGNGDALPSIAKTYDIEMVLIATPSATGREMTNILKYCQKADVAYKTVPGMAEIIESCGLAGQIREVAVEDLLGRTAVRIEECRIRDTIEGKVVLVTGAAGSIGSELCRQIAHFHPAGLVGFDIAESPLFELDREMRQMFPHVPFYPEIGSIQNRARLDDVLRQYKPTVVYHAAAYKHVPLMEAHVFEAIENNVFGTFNVAMAAAENGVEDFVMISSDKAVRPTNIMGVTKRVAELVLLALQNGHTKYVAVRFGNVLGSNGSVIPLFKKQIAAGGPVTVTHPEMRRFFMTIPEASQLVLQASAIGKGGQICVLDMGQPVKIVDLARNLIVLSGLKPDEDIKIEFTGIRPGEKIYEELSTLLEGTVPTDHEKIRIFIGDGMPEHDVQDLLDSLHQICEARDTGRLVVALKEIVQDYSPSTHLLKRVIKTRDQHTLAVASDQFDKDKKTTLPAEAV